MMKEAEKKEHIKPFNMAERLRSFSAAIAGIGVLIRHEHNVRIHLAILIVVVIAGLLLGISATEWLAIVILAGLVLMSECFNTAVENLSDMITREENEKIRRAKDVAAAGVLISAFAAVVAGLIIFLPHIVKLFGR